VAKTTNTTIRSMRGAAAVVRGRRKELGMNQAELARHAGVSRKWIYEFEGGKPTAEFGLLLRVLDELGLVLEVGPAGSTRAGTVDLDAHLDEHRRR
jgi:HTH-type transcriptional regulator/antitoxin HipB